MLKHCFRMILTTIAAIAMVSCVSHKELSYLQSGDASPLSIPLRPGVPYKIEPGDNLYIRVAGWEEKTYDFFNPGKGAQNIYSRDYFYFNGYLVDDSGTITMPVMGNIHVAGLNLEEAEDKIQGIANEYLKDGHVILRLANFYVTVTGEVGSPQQLTLHEENTTIFDVLALAGDITDAGNRKEVKLIRNNGDTATIYSLDLTKAQVLSNELLFVQPGDMVYVEPMRAKVLSYNISQVGGTLGLIISLITLISVLSL